MSTSACLMMSEKHRMALRIKLVSVLCLNALNCRNHLLFEVVPEELESTRRVDLACRIVFLLSRDDVTHQFQFHYFHLASRHLANLFNEKVQGRWTDCARDVFEHVVKVHLGVLRRFHRGPDHL